MIAEWVHIEYKQRVSIHSEHTKNWKKNFKKDSFINKAEVIIKISDEQKQNKNSHGKQKLKYSGHWDWKEGVDEVFQAPWGTKCAHYGESQRPKALVISEAVLEMTWQGEEAKLLAHSSGFSNNASICYHRDWNDDFLNKQDPNLLI